MSRPEHQAPPEIYYNSDEAEKYTRNTRIIKIQRELTERAIELLQLPTIKDSENEDEKSDSEGMDDYNSSESEVEPEMSDSAQSIQNQADSQFQTDPKLVLDIGCGSGLSGEILSENGHYWIGCDISTAMLDVATEREVEGDLILHDMGHGLPFRAGTFDAAISISALQWLCNQDKTVNKPSFRLKYFFESLYSCLKHGATAVLQFYPENVDQTEFLYTFACRAGFTGGIVTDFPNSTKKKKHFLVLFCGVKTNKVNMPESLTETHSISSIKFSKKERLCDLKRKGKISNRDWIQAKKEKRRLVGKSTANDSKYTGRKRRPKF